MNAVLNFTGAAPLLPASVIAIDPLLTIQAAVAIQVGRA
jgi:hypothetical protein